jgi:hypothetical protein
VVITPAVLIEDYEQEGFLPIGAVSKGRINPMHEPIPLLDIRYAIKLDCMRLRMHIVLRAPPE